MKKIIVNGLCATLVCFFLSSFTANSNNVGDNTPSYSTTSPSQDTTKSKKKMKKDKSGDTTKMKMKKKPS